MSEGILVALIGFAGVIISNIITNSNSNKKLVGKIQTENNKVINEFKLEVTKNQAITDTKIEELTREVREHNNFAKRMPAVEEGIENLKEKVNFFHKIS